MGRLETAAAKDHKADDGLLRALRLSQSRAREAEDKLAAAGATNVDLAALLVRDSVALSAHRRWVMMLEAENSLLRGPRRDADGPEPDTEPAGWPRGGSRSPSASASPASASRSAGSSAEQL